MKIKELLQEAPEMTEENFLNIIQDNLPLLRYLHLLRRIQECNKGLEINKAIMAEFDKMINNHTLQVHKGKFFKDL